MFAKVRTDHAMPNGATQMKEHGAIPPKQGSTETGSTVLSIEVKAAPSHLSQNQIQPWLTKALQTNHWKLGKWFV